MRAHSRRACSAPVAATAVLPARTSRANAACRPIVPYLILQSYKRGGRSRKWLLSRRKDESNLEALACVKASTSEPLRHGTGMDRKNALFARITRYKWRVLTEQVEEGSGGSAAVRVSVPEGTWRRTLRGEHYKDERDVKLDSMICHAGSAFRPPRRNASPIVSETALHVCSTRLRLRWPCVLFYWPNSGFLFSFSSASF